MARDCVPRGRSWVMVLWASTAWPVTACHVTVLAGQHCVACGYAPRGTQLDHDAGRPMTQCWEKKKRKKKERGRGQHFLTLACVPRDIIAWVTVLTFPWPNADRGPWRHVSAGVKAPDFSHMWRILIGQIWLARCEWPYLFPVQHNFWIAMIWSLFIRSGPDFIYLFFTEPPFSFSHLALHISCSCLGQVIRWFT